MKRILITGEGSYIGTSFGKWVSQWAEQYEVETIDMRNKDWKTKSFNSYDVVYHTAAIVHVKENNIDQYFKVNRDLAVEVAKKAKEEGVKQFIFLSTMGVYGMETGYIDVNTEPNPKTPYAKSKLEAEKLLRNLADDKFKVATLRPPIVYGKGCRGNYPRLAGVALKAPVFPKVKNERSMIFIDNLSEFVKQVIDHEVGGLFFPQNKEYVNTTELVKVIAKTHGKVLRSTGLFYPVVYLCVKLSETFGKVFGSFVYDRAMAGGPSEFNYETCSFEESIKKTEKEEVV